MGRVKTRSFSCGFAENTGFLAAFVCLMVAQLGMGCASSVSSGSPPTPQPTQLTISSDLIPSAKVQTAYSATLKATGGTAPYTWSVAAGALPAGLNLSRSTGQISGTPSQAGNSSFTVQVTDSTSPAQTAKVQLSIMVAATTASVQIISSSVPSGQVGALYSATLAAAGGTTPYSWNISSGALPAGLTLSSTGIISGTPTEAGTFGISVEVTDSGSPASSASANFSVTIAAASYSAALSWTASASSDVTGYNVYRSTVSGGRYAKINSSLVAGSTYADSTVVNGQTYYYVTTSVDSTGVESLNSNEVQAVMP
jgi:hypothetical protein